MQRRFVLSAVLAAALVASGTLAPGSYRVHIAAPDAASALAATPAYAVRFANADNVVTGVQWQASTGRLALGSTVQVQ